MFLLDEPTITQQPESAARKRRQCPQAAQRAERSDEH